MLASSLVSGNDFYSSPRLSPDGSQLAWLTWNHPEHAVGRYRAVGRQTEQRRFGKRAMQRSPAVSMNRSSSPSGRRTASFTSSRTAPAGGISIAGKKTKSNRSVRWKRNLANPNGFSAPLSYGFAAAGHLICTYAQRRPRLPRQSGYRDRERLATIDSSVHDYFASSQSATTESFFIGASSTETDFRCLVGLDYQERLKSCDGHESQPSIAGYTSLRAGDRVSHCEQTYRARHISIRRRIMTMLYPRTRNRRYWSSATADRRRRARHR